MFSKQLELLKFQLTEKQKQLEEIDLTTFTLNERIIKLTKEISELNQKIESLELENKK